MSAHRAYFFHSALTAILGSAVGGAESEIAQGMVSISSKPASRLRSLNEVTAPRSQVIEEVSTGPDPFFSDLVPSTPLEDEEQGGGEIVENKAPPRMYYVEVYENESRGLGRRWRELRPGFATPRWSYKDGSAALPPAEILPPDDWGWVSDWKIDGSGGRDVWGWEYTKELGKFGSSRVPRGKKLADRFRRRRWVRAMRPQRERQQQGSNEAGLQLESLSDTMGMGAPALHVHAYEHDAEDFRFDLGRDIDVDLLPAPNINEMRDGTSAAPLNLLAFGQALTAFKGWWTEEFTFRGFGIGFVKPIFRGMLLRPDVGVGIRLPVTLHFRSWEKQEALPSISASFFVLWPPAVQVSQALSYPAELLQEWTMAAARKIVVPSREALKARQRKEAVQRLGVSVGVRYSATYGFQWWLAPYIFLLPGVRIMWHLYQSMMTLLLSSMALMYRDGPEADSNNQQEERDEAIWLVALRSWAAAKTSGLGYSLHYSGSRLGGAVLVNFMPFFLPTVPVKKSKSTTTSVESVVKEEELAYSAAGTDIAEKLRVQEAVVQRVADEVEQDEALKAADAGRHEGAVLQACAA